MDLDDQIRCLFTARLSERDGSYVLEVPEQEVDLGNLDVGDTYRVGVLPSDATPEAESAPRTGRQGTTRTRQDTTTGSSSDPPEPPVSEGEQREVEIEDIGDQGDGIARVERGFVIIVPDTREGERVTVEITDVQRNVAFADVVGRHDYRT